MVWKAYKINRLLDIEEMFSFFEIYCEENYEFRGESHNFWECLYVEKGEVCVSADERVYSLKEGSIIFHKPLEFHKFYIDSGKFAKIAVFSFSLEGQLSNYFRSKVFILSEEQKAIFYSMIDYVRKTVKKAGDIEDVMYLQCLQPFKISKTYPQMLTTYLYQLFLSLVDNGTASDIIYNSYDADLFRQAVDYMNSNVSMHLSVADIAEFCNTSEATLKRTFDKYAGIGVHKYFMQIKIKAAAELLQDGVSVSNTAERLGFSSQGYFSATFKRETGKLPSEIREKQAAVK